MRVEVLYFPGCPHRGRAIEEVGRALVSEEIAAAITEIEIRDNEEAERHKFCGSPTIRINGRDVAPASPSARVVGLQCRLYPGSEQPGVPPHDLLRRALREAMHEEES
ncbi:MAG TPA: hypothetical protein VGS15_09445 [Candidatus Acidoferrales bacterium]|nr:hypothetical protein [Candidatus Acidoferrales bacterium]